MNCHHYNDGYPIDGCGACEPCRRNDARTAAILAGLDNGTLDPNDHDLYCDTRMEIAADRLEEVS